ncbi:hypothetical protein COW46_01875 [Candidatus Gracilibacteria bacterium CG17_big_fil_post_rev_8_21_14_2_50_48_13]|nr:MAG: hypothetical protein COW46_01875 [Candidatus Gracilibacteria bacterium CG17_big_fil_post_rev_8_21_14_2_50_48_13]
MGKPVSDQQQKFLAFGGIFLCIFLLSALYAQGREGRESKKPAGLTLEQALAVVPEGVADTMPAPMDVDIPVQIQPEPSVAEVPAVSQNTPTMSGGTLQAQTSPSSMLTFLTSMLITQGYSTRQDLAWDRTIFDRLIPVTGHVAMMSYLVADQTGATVGRVTTIEATDPAESAYDQLLLLALQAEGERISVSETSRRNIRMFLYNDLDKKENLRIVVQASAREALAIDLPAYLQSVADAALSQL